MKWQLTYVIDFHEFQGDRCVEFDRWVDAVNSALNLVWLGAAATKPCIRAVRP